MNIKSFKGYLKRAGKKKREKKIGREESNFHELAPTGF